MKIKNLILFIIIIIVMFFASNVTFFPMTEYGDGKSRQNDFILAERIYDGIRTEIEGPILVAKSMAKDSLLVEFLKHENEHSEEYNVEQMKRFLEGLKDVADYDSVYVISEESRRYYTDRGLNKIINPQGDSHDIWYDIIMGKNDNYNVDVDKDQDNEDSYTIFINVKILDVDGKILGICGVGISLDKIQAVFENYETAYNLKVNLVNEEGLVQVDVNDINVETTYCVADDFTKASEYQYSNSGFEGFTISRYVDELDWYLVVKEEKKATLLDRIDYNFVKWSLVLLLLITLISILLFRKNYFYSDTVNQGNTDLLTGLPNRNYFKEVYGEHGIYNTTRYKSMVFWDIDYFKEANDTVDGDKVLVDIVAIAKECFGEKGMMFRWGGDGFMIMMEWSVDFGYELCKEFCKRVEKESEVTISIGITEVKLSDVIKKNYHRAVQGCYLVKEMGGNGVKRN